MSNFKVGDKVKIKVGGVSDACTTHGGEETTISAIISGHRSSLGRSDNYAETSPNIGNYWLTDLILIENNMSIKEQFTLALTPEPQKTFRKLGITNGDNLLTDEGGNIFLTWLLSKNQEAFKTEVCVDMLVEQEKK